MHPLQLKLDAVHTSDESDEPDEPGRVDGADVSEEYLHDEVPLKNTSHLMFITPAYRSSAYLCTQADAHHCPPMAQLEARHHLSTSPH